MTGLSIYGTSGNHSVARGGQQVADESRSVHVYLVTRTSVPAGATAVAHVIGTCAPGGTWHRTRKAQEDTKHAQHTININNHADYYRIKMLNQSGIV